MELEPLYQFSQSFLALKRQPFRRYFLDVNHRLTEQCSILLGQRGIGKTTIITQVLLDDVNGDLFDPRIMYLQVDHYLLKGLSLFEIARAFYLHGGKYLAFDEIHQYENWSGELKSIIDSFPTLKLIVSGSSALEIQKGSHDLSRRSIVYRLVGMSLREFIALNYGITLDVYSLDNILEHHQSIANTLINKLAVSDKKILPLFQQYLLCGYYPYFHEFSNIDKFNMTLEQNIHYTLASDLLSIHTNLNSHSIKKMELLLTFIARSVPYTPNFSQLKSTLGIGDERTLKNYLTYLEDAGLIVCVYKTGNKLNKIETPAKIYLQNPNLMHAISPVDTQVGTIRELAFYNMVSKDHRLTLPLSGDFLIDNKIVIEIGGHKKSMKQIKDHHRAYVVSDDIEIGFESKIPLWLFGFLY